MLYYDACRRLCTCVYIYKTHSYAYMIHLFSLNDESTVWIPLSTVGNSLSIFVWKRLLTTRVRNTGELWRSKSVHTYLNNIEPNIWTKWYTVSWDIGVFKCESLGRSGFAILSPLSWCEPSSFSWLQFPGAPVSERVSKFGSFQFPIRQCGSSLHCFSLQWIQ